MLYYYLWESFQIKEWQNLGKVPSPPIHLNIFSQVLPSNDSRFVGLGIMCTIFCLLWKKIAVLSMSVYLYDIIQQLYKVEKGRTVNEESETTEEISEDNMEQGKHSEE